MSAGLSLEVCAFNIQSCIIAERAGAARVELCADPLQGGTTPSYGLIRHAREKLSIALYPIIRPREGDFFYDDDDEFIIMKKDIAACKEIGCDGISTGIQLANGKIDIVRMKQLVELAYPMRVTCHRVFDTAPDLHEALEDLINAGCERILTSGGKAHAADAVDILTSLVKAADGRISIMPGSGVRSANINQLKQTGAKEFHTTARLTPQPNTIDIKVFDPGHLYIADENELKKIMDELSK